MNPDEAELRPLAFREFGNSRADDDVLEVVGLPLVGEFSFAGEAALQSDIAQIRSLGSELDVSRSSETQPRLNGTLARPIERVWSILTIKASRRTPCLRRSKVSSDQTPSHCCCTVRMHHAANSEPGGTLMEKPSQTRHRKVEAGARRGKLPDGAVNVPSRPPKMTATLKRRALRKRSRKLALPRSP